MKNASLPKKSYTNYDQLNSGGIFYWLLGNN